MEMLGWLPLSCVRCLLTQALSGESARAGIFLAFSNIPDSSVMRLVKFDIQFGLCKLENISVKTLSLPNTERIFFAANFYVVLSKEKLMVAFQTKS